LEVSAKGIPQNTPARGLHNRYTLHTAEGEEGYQKPLDLFTAQGCNLKGLHFKEGHTAHILKHKVPASKHKGDVTFTCSKHKQGRT
jgi:hypothetical protein